MLSISSNGVETSGIDITSGKVLSACPSVRGLQKWMADGDEDKDDDDGTDPGDQELTQNPKELSDTPFASGYRRKKLDI